MYWPNDVSPHSSAYNPSSGVFRHSLVNYCGRVASSRVVCSVTLNDGQKPSKETSHWWYLSFLRKRRWFWNWIWPRELQLRWIWIMWWTVWLGEFRPPCHKIFPQIQKSTISSGLNVILTKQVIGMGNLYLLVFQMFVYWWFQMFLFCNASNNFYWWFVAPWCSRDKYICV